MYYSYKGPVMVFGKITNHMWEATTQAVSEKKAYSNLCYQYKKRTGHTNNYKVTLPGKLKMSSVI